MSKWFGQQISAVLYQALTINKSLSFSNVPFQNKIATKAVSLFGIDHAEINFIFVVHFNIHHSCKSSCRSYCIVHAGINIFVVHLKHSSLVFKVLSHCQSYWCVTCNYTKYHI